MQTIPQTESAGTLAFDAALLQASAKAKAAYPAEGVRIERGLQIALSKGVSLSENGHAIVRSQSMPGQTYDVNGSCPCPDAHYRAPEGRCAHRWAKSLMLWTCRQTPVATVVAHDITPHEPQPDAVVDDIPAHRSIPMQYVAMIQGKPFIRYAGLLVMAHERGLTSLKTVFTYNDATLSLAECTAVFPFGTFTDIGDATPENVNRTVAPHFRRVAATRATARTLRQALNIDMVALEEVAEGA